MAFWRLCRPIQDDNSHDANQRSLPEGGNILYNTVPAGFRGPFVRLLRPKMPDVGAQAPEIFNYPKNNFLAHFYFSIFIGIFTGNYGLHLFNSV